MYPDDLYYIESHQWARVEGNLATIGLTHYAQDQLGDLVYIELPQVGSEVNKDQPFGSVESVKAVADVNSPVSGKVTAVNSALEDTPEQVNQDCYGEGWMIKVEMTNPGELSSCLRADAYTKFVASLGTARGEGRES